MAQVFIRCGPSGATRPSLLGRCREVVEAGAPHRVLWLGPTYRALAAIRPLLPAGVAAPRQCTFHDLAGAIIAGHDPQARPISHLQRRLLAEELAAVLAARGRLDHFRGILDTRGFTETLFTLLSELKQAEIPPDEFHHIVEKNSPTSAKQIQCALLYRDYQQLLARHHWYDLEGRLWYARDLLHADKVGSFDELRFIFVDGFSQFTRAQRDILELLGARSEELWLTLPHEADQEREELFRSVRQTLDALKSCQSRERERPEPAPLRSLTLHTLTEHRAGNHVSAVDVTHEQNSSPSPAGLAHLRRELFRLMKKVRKADSAEGVDLIQAPGAVGEVRMVALRIRQLLSDSTPADDILVVARNIGPYADLIGEVFAEYQIPLDVEGTMPLLRVAAVSTLLRALRVADEGYPFAQVTALLRSNYFRPTWPEAYTSADLAARTEALLRLLGQPRGRESYLAAARRWAENPPAGLEDEDAEESRRQHIHELAKTCRHFLHRFLHCWDQAPDHATLDDHIGWLRKLAEDLGIRAAAAADTGDHAALERLWSELEQWASLHQDLHSAEQRLSRVQFQRLAGTVAAGAGLARSRRGPGRVQVLSAPLARSLSAPRVFLIGLGERSFPQLNQDTLFDDAERQTLRHAGLNFPCLADLLPDEMLLFYQIVTAASVHLTLSYPAVDERGQELLPSSFLATLLACFQPNVVPTERRSMLIERYARDIPLSLAEYRVQAALALAAGDAPWPLPTGVAGQVEAAQQAAQLRFEARAHGVYDGRFHDPTAIAEVLRRFGPERVFSPTALESYSACPFKFLLGHVLRLEPLDEPSEEIESTDRGMAVHRALSRFHGQLRADGVHDPVAEIEGQLLEQLAVAVEESATRATPAAEALWRLEGERLKRLAARYHAQWTAFQKPWLPRRLLPRPELFEAGFGLPAAEGEAMPEALVVEFGGIEVRVSGRIDRVDVVELPNGAGLGFWIIDYKTGRSPFYTAGDLREFRRLQLTLYALAVEKVLLAGRNARPLGLAYWFVADNGPKVVLPGHPRHLDWLDKAELWRRFRDELERRVVESVARIRAGQFPLKPASRDCTQTCEYGRICRISQSRNAVEKKTWPLPLV